MKTQIVLGSFFGDEGKGATVQWLCGQAISNDLNPVVTRFSGGPQAGHRIIKDGTEHVSSSFGSGVLLGVPTILNQNVMIDPISMKIEYDALRSKGIMPKLYINSLCRVISPYDVLANIHDKKNLEDGSCGKGVFQTYKRCHDSCCDNNEAWNEEATISFAINNPVLFLRKAREFHNQFEEKGLERMFLDAVRWLEGFATLYGDSNPTEEFDMVIFEGSQGLLLDMECGFMPNCTLSRVGLNGITAKYLEQAEVFMVMRPYITRHGNGFDPLGDDTTREAFTINEPTNSDGGFQGRFKYGIFDETLLSRVFDRHHLDNFKLKHQLKFYCALTHMDCIANIYIPVLNKKNETIRMSDVEFKNFINGYFDKLYCSYRPDYDINQFQEHRTAKLSG